MSHKGQALVRSRACFSVRVSLTAGEFPTCSGGLGIIARRPLAYSASGSGVGWSSGSRPGLRRYAAAFSARLPSQSMMSSSDTSELIASGRKELLPPPHCCHTGAWAFPASSSPSVAAKVLRCSLGSPRVRKARRVAWSAWVNTSVAVGRWRWRWRWRRFSRVLRR